MQDYLLLAQLRIKNNLTQKKMAEIIGVSLSTYKLYECGLRMMKLPSLNKLSIYFKISLNRLIGLKDINQNIDYAKSINYNILKANIILIRKKLKLTQKQWADIIKFSEHAISNYESNPHKISLLYLYCLAQKSSLSIDYICGKTNQKN